MVTISVYSHGAGREVAEQYATMAVSQSIIGAVARRHAFVVKCSQGGAGGREAGIFAAGCIPRRGVGSTGAQETCGG